MTVKTRRKRRRTKHSARREQLLHRCGQAKNEHSTALSSCGGARHVRVAATARALCGSAEPATCDGRSRRARRACPARERRVYRARCERGTSECAARAFAARLFPRGFGARVCRVDSPRGWHRVPVPCASIASSTRGSRIRVPGAFAPVPRRDQRLDPAPRAARSRPWGPQGVRTPVFVMLSASSARIGKHCPRNP